MRPSLLHFALLVASRLVCAEEARYERPSAQIILSDLQKHSPNRTHPRLLVTGPRFAEIKALRSADKNVQAWCAELKTQVDEILTKEPVAYSTTGFSGVLTQSRTVVRYAQVLGLMYRLTGERRYADRLWKEVSTVCDRAQFKDWGPSRYADTVEMATGVALAYDWLFDVWSDEQKKLMRENIREQCLQYVVKRMATPDKPGGKKITNIRLVYTGGSATAALAIADEADSQELATQVISEALRYAEPGMALFAPDGGWYEGARYWGYAVQYHEYLLASLAAATGSTYGLLTAPGFARTGDFPVYLKGPTGNFDFHDDDTRSKIGDQFSWFGQQFDVNYGRLRVAEIAKLAALHETTQKRIAEEAAKNTAEGRKAAKELARADSGGGATVLDVLFYRPAFATGSVTLQNDCYFRDAETATFRSGWNDPDALFLGVHFGANEGAHAHLDMGTFVLDAQGVRWVADCGGGSYDWRGYLESDATKGHPYRFDYYLARAEGHNTIVINPNPQALDQNISAVTRIEPYQSNPLVGLAIADLTSAYAPKVIGMKRGFLFDRGQRTVVVQDEITTAAPATIHWGIHTAAKITIAADRRSAILEQDGQRLYVGILSRQPAGFSIVQLPLMPPMSKGSYRLLQKLAIVFEETREVRLTVLFTSLIANQNAPTSIPPVKSLAEWNASTTAR